MCGTSLTYPGYYGHCIGCRCFQSTTTDDFLWTFPTPTPTKRHIIKRT